MDMVSFIISSAPITLFYIFAIWISHQQRTSQPKLSNLCMAIFSAMLIHQILGGVIMFGLQSPYDHYDAEPNLLVSLYENSARLITMGLEASLLFCIFAWRKQSSKHYKKPALVVAALIAAMLLAEGLNAIIYGVIFNGHLSPEEFEMLNIIVAPCISSIFAMILLCSLFAIYGWRGDDFNNKLLYMLTLKIDPNAEQEEVEAGFFETTEYIPFLIALFMFGGLIAVPLIWGGVLDIDYHKTLLPAFISCACFAYCHNRKGRFLWNRLFIITAFIAYVLFKITLKGGGDEQFFVAGGVLGYPVMFGCGWIGVMIVRFGKRMVASCCIKLQTKKAGA